MKYIIAFFVIYFGLLIFFSYQIHRIIKKQRQATEVKIIYQLKII